MTKDYTSLPAAIIFDMDGVLLDSSPFHVRKWQGLLEAHGIPYDEGELRRTVLGPSNEANIRRYLGDGLSREQLAALGEELDAIFRREIGPHLSPLPGVREFIERCHARGIPMAVASAAIASNVTFLISALGLREYFREVLAVDSTAHAKPHPEIYLKTAEKLGIQPSACVVFEDSFVGIEAAKRAGMKCIAIASTFSPDDLRRQTAADLIIPDFRHISFDDVEDLFSDIKTPETRAGN